MRISRIARVSTERFEVHFEDPPEEHVFVLRLEHHSSRSTGFSAPNEFWPLLGTISNCKVILSALLRVDNGGPIEFPIPLPDKA